MIRVLIVDDEPVIRREIESLLITEPEFIVIGKCGSVIEAQTLILATNPDLIFLDITLTDGSAFDLLNSLREISFQVIFITSFNQFAIKAIKCGALDYLLKPIDEPEFRISLEKVKSRTFTTDQLETGLKVAGSYLNNTEPVSQGRIVLRSQHYLDVVSWNDIMYCQSQDGYTHFHLVDTKKVVVSKPIKEYDVLLPAQLFLRPHQSYLVNVNFVDRFHKDGCLILKDGKEIPVSTRKKDHVVSYLVGESLKIPWKGRA